MVFVLSLCFSFSFTVINASANESIYFDVLSDEYEIGGDAIMPLVSVTNTLKGLSILVVPARYDSSTGAYQRVLNQELWSTTGSGYSPYNCTVSRDITQWMVENNFDLFYVELIYNISGGASSYRVEFSVDNPEWTNYNTSVTNGNYLVQYMVPMKYHTYDLKVTPSGSLNALYLGGHIAIV